MPAARLIAAIALALAFTAGGARAQSLGADHVKVALAAETDGAAPGSTLQLAVVQDIDPGWHTYWRNPGDAGEATRIVWSLPAGWRAGDIVWPAPRRLPVGPLMNYGYRGRVLLPVAVQVPAGARPGSSLHVAALVSMLVCADICVPQDAHVGLDVPIVAAAPPPDRVWAGRIEATLAAAPRPAALMATYQRVGGALHIAIAGAPLVGRAGTRAYFFPYDGRLIAQGKPEAIDLGERGLTLAATPGALFQQTPAPARIEGVLKTADGAAFEIAATPGPPPPQSGGLGPPARSAAMGLGLAALFAFIGGLILNLMPCVFPVLAMKAASLIRRPQETRHARRQGLAFLAGVLAAFLGLAGALIAARAAGAPVGWGSQLQPAIVTAVLSLVMLAAALDLSGVYEIGASLQGLGAGLAARADLIGAAFTGILAVVVAAPCTAPFMAPALGYAFTLPPAGALAVFAALGLGFALPFTLLAFIPGFARLLPRPGPWMDGLRKALAFPMYGAAAWLVWVLAQQSDPATLAAVLAAAVLVALCAWIFGAAQRRAASGARARATFAGAGLAGALALAAVAAAPYGATPDASAAPAMVAGAPVQPWSPERIAALRAQGTPIFVDFTAAWCVTCQFNERVALDTREASEAFRRTGAAYLKADWTNRNPAIAKALADEGRAGVPLYLVYGADGGAPKVLPQLLTPGVVVRALDAAAGRQS